MRWSVRSISSRGRLLRPVLLLCLCAPGAWAAGEVRLNTDVSGAYQGYAASAAAPDGRILAVWEDARLGGNDIYMQRFARDLTSLGTNVRVNDSVLPEQFAPAVACDPTGVFWVVWQDFRATGYPQNGDIYLQRVRADGSKVGVNVLINDDGSLSTQKEPEIAVNGSEVLVVWSDFRRGEWDIYSQRYDFNAHTLGMNLLLNDETNAAPQHAPQVSALANGYFAVVWYDTREGDEDIFLQRMNAVGGSLAGANVRASNAPAGSRQRFPCVGAGPADGFTVAWEDYRTGIYPAGSRLYAQAFTAVGVPLGSDYEVDGGDDQVRPRFASDAVGNRVLVWEQKLGSSITLRQRKYPHDVDTALATGPVGPDTAAGERTRPRVALGAGGILYTWTDRRSGNFDAYLAREDYRFPTFLPYPSELVFERPIRLPDTTLVDTVNVQAVGFVQRRIAFGDRPAWLDIEPSAALTPAQFTFTMQGANIEADTSVAVYAIDLDDTSAREPVLVTARVVRPELLARPPSLLLDVSAGAGDSAAVVISNRQPGPLDWWHLPPLSPWWARRTGDTVWVGYPGTLAASIIEDTLWVTDTLAINSPLAVPLAVEDGHVPPTPPYLVVIPSLVTWRSTSGSATTDSAKVLITTSYDTSISLRLTDYPSWLYVSDTAGWTPQAVSFRAAYDSIPYGVYQDTVWIEAPDASNNPYALPILFTADVTSSVTEAAASVPATNLVARPNPFNASVLIEWAGTPPAGTVEVFDVLGRSVLKQAASSDRFIWNPARGQGSGVYFLTWKSGGRTLSIRLLYLK